MVTLCTQFIMLAQTVEENAQVQGRSFTDFPNILPQTYRRNQQFLMSFGRCSRGFREYYRHITRRPVSNVKRKLACCTLPYLRAIEFTLHRYQTAIFSKTKRLQECNLQNKLTLHVTDADAAVMRFTECFDLSQGQEELRTPTSRNPSKPNRQHHCVWGQIRWKKVSTIVKVKFKLDTVLL